MGLQINTNVTALGALRNLENVTNSVNTSIERLSSGLRINSGADDPSGLIISESLKAQVGGLNQAISNSQDATNVVKTAEGALTQVTSLLDTIRQLAVHASNTGVNDSTDVQADQTQINSAVASIQRIAQQTQFGDKNLLDGTSGTTAAVVDTSAASGMYIGGSFGGGSTQTGTVNMSVTTAATQAAVQGTQSYGSLGSTVAAGTIVLNGQSIALTGSDTVQTMVNKINNLTSTTGVAADISGNSGSGYEVNLVQTNYGANFGVTESESTGLIFATGAGATSVVGVNASVAVGATTLVNGSAVTVTTTFNGGVGAGTSGLNVTDANGNSILLTEAGNAATDTTVAIGSVTAGAVQFQIGANAGQTVTLSLGNITTSQLGNTAVAGKSLASIDVTTAQGAQDAIQIADQAISQVTTLNANLGAFQTNTLQSTINYLGVSSENLSASESDIADTDVATEVVNLTKNQIIAQAATSVLAQANSAPQNVLKLLQ